MKYAHVHDGRIFSTRLNALIQGTNSLVLPLDPLAPQQWYLKNSGQESPKGIKGTVGADIRFTRLDLMPDNDKEVILAVIDSGIDLSHPDIDLARLYFNPGEMGTDQFGRERRSNGIDDDNNGYVDDSLGWSFSSNSSNISDSLGHGTHVTGLLASKNNNRVGLGSPWKGFKIMPLQIFDAQHPTADHNTIARAIRYAVDNGAHVISASFGSSTPSKVMQSAVEYAALNDVILVSAVGNFRKNTDLEPTYPAHFGYSNQIAVASSDRRDIASNFSNFGKSSVDIFAPGEEIISADLNGGYAIRSGTSQACPLVSGAIATAKHLYFEESAEKIIRRALTAADEVSGLEVFSQDGLRVNVDNIILRKQGTRLEFKDHKHWQSVDFALESEHPYRSNASATFQISAPPQAKMFRVHFEHFSTQSTDVVDILDQDHRVVTSFSGQLDSLWTPVIRGNRGYLKFTTDRFVSDYGWKIDQVKFLE